MQSVDLILTKAGALAIGLSATVHTAAAGVLDLAKVHLTVNPEALDEDSVVADITDAANVPTYTGYAEESITWGTGRETGDGEPVYIGTTGEFHPTDSVGGSLIKSMAILNTAGSVVIAVANFPGLGVSLGTALDTMTPNILFRPQGGSSVEILP